MKSFFMSRGRIFNIAIPLIAILLGMLVGGIIMLVSGYNPINGYGALFTGILSEPFYIGETVRAMTPLILSGLAVAFAYRAGLLNIGVEGQVIVGWLAAVYVGIVVEAPMIIHLPLAILAGAAAGALWAFVPGLLKAKFHVNEVIVCIMMNYVGYHVVNSIIRAYLIVPGERTDNIQPTASLQSAFLESITDYSRIHYGIIVAILACLFMWFLLWKTSLGYELRSVGYNQHASRYAGMSVGRNVIITMVISGSFAGLAGAMQGLGMYGYMTILTGFTNIGFDGIAVALLGANSSIGIFLSAFLFGGLKSGAATMQSQAGVPVELIDIVIALIIFFVASSYIIRWALLRIQKKKEGNQ